METIAVPHSIHKGLSRLSNPWSLPPGIVLLSGHETLFVTGRGRELLEEVKAERLDGVAVGWALEALREAITAVHQADWPGCAVTVESSEHISLGSKGDRWLVLQAIKFSSLGGQKGNYSLLLMQVVEKQEFLALAKQQYSLTVREVSVVTALAKGWTNRRIADDLGIRETTVKVHIRNIMSKTGAQRRTEILAKVLGLDGVS